MARTQFTFTFTNAQPGADVHFSAPVYPDASTSTPDGPTLVLSSSNAVSVWADAGFLVAVSVDGNGNEISATATAGSPTVSTDSGTAGTSPFGSGGSAPDGIAIVRAFPFAFDTPGLVTGHSIYTPTVGDILLDAWLQIDEAWDGTTPTGDIGTLVGTNAGLYNYSIPAGAIDMTAVDDPSSAGEGMLIGYGTPGLLKAGAAADVDEIYQVPAIASTPASQQRFAFKNAVFYAQTARVVPALFTVANPIKVCVSTTGQNDGGDPASTQGAATLYLVTCTPATA